MTSPSLLSWTCCGAEGALSALFALESAVADEYRSARSTRRVGIPGAPRQHHRMILSGVLALRVATGGLKPQWQIQAAASLI